VRTLHHGRRAKSGTLGRIESNPHLAVEIDDAPPAVRAREQILCLAARGRCRCIGASGHVRGSRPRSAASAKSRLSDALVFRTTPAHQSAVAVDQPPSTRTFVPVM
jgi:hypothetical protein